MTETRNTPGEQQPQQVTGDHGGWTQVQGQSWQSVIWTTTVVTWVTGR